MSSTLARTVSSLAIPAALLLALWIALHQFALPDSLSAALELAPPVVCVTGALLGLRFHRARVTLSLIALGAGAWMLHGGAEALPSAFLRDQAPALCALLIPFYLGLFGAVGERGLMTWQGALQLGLAVAPLLGVAWLAQPQHRELAAGLHADFLPEVFGPLPHVALIVFGLAAAALLARLVLARAALDGGFLVALVGAFMALRAAALDRPQEATALFAATGLLLIVALVQDSYSMAYLDELTRLPGRRALNEQLLRLGRTYTIAMLDVDHFKKFNDKYGHDVGDQVLRLVATRMRDVTGGGRPFRYGGEEFTIVFPRRSAAEVMEHLEKVRASIEEARLTLRAPDRPSKKPKTPRKPANAPQVSVTISIGVAERGGALSDPQQVIEAADKALYRAKKKGRNCVST